VYKVGGKIILAFMAEESKKSAFVVKSRSSQGLILRKYLVSGEFFFYT